MKRRKNKNFSRLPESEKKGYLRHEESVGNTKILISGLVVLTAAFFVLRLANPEGNNFAAGAAPFVFIFSWALILTGILWNGRKEEKSEK